MCCEFHITKNNAIREGKVLVGTTNHRKEKLINTFGVFCFLIRYSNKVFLFALNTWTLVFDTSYIAVTCSLSLLITMFVRDNRGVTCEYLKKNSVVIVLNSDKEVFEVLPSALITKYYASSNSVLS